jgi:hypothetical protein
MSLKLSKHFSSLRTGKDHLYYVYYFYIRETKTLQVNNLGVYLKFLEK